MAKKDKDKSEECSEIIEKKSDNKATNYFDSDYWRVNIDQRRSSIQQRDHIISTKRFQPAGKNNSLSFKENKVWATRITAVTC